MRENTGRKEGGKDGHDGGGAAGSGGDAHASRVMEQGTRAGGRVVARRRPRVERWAALCHCTGRSLSSTVSATCEAGTGRVGPGAEGGRRWGWAEAGSGEESWAGEWRNRPSLVYKPFPFLMGLKIK